ncbi:MAG TPA: deoxynucleoside kinase, partial [Gammaproteobacteria bacterium]|nr:deoxynucleoside kinase [Gammaproteobacteria bacterium]
EELRQARLFSPVRVADYLLEKDRLFAKVTMDSDEYRLYEQIHAQLTLEAPVPDLVIYLQAPVEVLLQRVKKRGRSYERHIEAGYLRHISEAYARLFHNYDLAPVLIVNATGIDLVDNEQDYEQLLQRICDTRSGRHYFNPLPLELQG